MLNFLHAALLETSFQGLLEQGNCDFGLISRPMQSALQAEELLLELKRRTPSQDDLSIAKLQQLDYALLPQSLVKALGRNSYVHCCHSQIR